MGRHRRQLRPRLLCWLGLRSDVEGQLVDLAGELERRILAILDHRDAGAGVLPDVEGLVLRERDRRAVFNGFSVHFLAVHGEHARPSLAQPWTIRLEVEDDGVLASAQLWPRPNRSLEVKQVVEEHWLAPTNACHALAQEKSIAAEAPPFGDDHAFSTALGDLDLGGDGVGLVQDTWRSTGPYARHLAR